MKSSLYEFRLSALRLEALLAIALPWLNRWGDEGGEKGTLGDMELHGATASCISLAIDFLLSAPLRDETVTRVPPVLLPLLSLCPLCVDLCYNLVT